MAQGLWKTLVVVAVLGVSCGPAVPVAGTDAGSPDSGLPDAGGQDAGCGCGPQRCLSDGGCGECESDAHCPSQRPVCDTALNTCIGCRETPDSCDADQHCVAGTCVPGCRANAGCSSGVCLLATHDCLNCRDDSECADGRLCGTGTCAPGCTTTCAAGWTCCGGRCVDATRDPGHCGACTQPCDAGAFCGRGVCRAAVLSNTCELPIATVLRDGIDDPAGQAMANALAAACPLAVSVRSADQVDGGLLDAVTGEPLVSGQMLCTAGGSYRQRAIAWLEQNGLAPVTDTSTSTVFSYSLRDGGVVTQGPLSSLNAAHDVIVVQLARAPSGATVLNAAGYYTEGTAAAAWYFVNVLLPTRATLTDGWTVVDWADSNVNGAPDTLDTWTPIASGR